MAIVAYGDFRLVSPPMPCNPFSQEYCVRASIDATPGKVSVIDSKAHENQQCRVVIDR
jgi:hypothetical protein